MPALTPPGAMRVTPPGAMRALVLSNCSYPAYTAYMQTMFPHWDVRGVFLPQATTWVRDGHPAFMAFLDQIDIFIGMTAMAPVNALVKPGVIRVLLPYFTYHGYHPDALWLHGLPSPLENGVLHSAIAASAWLLGKSVPAAQALFCAAHFDRLGYFAAPVADRARVTAMFADPSGIDIDPLFADWARAGNFMHTPNHPKPPVFFDIIHAGMVQAGFGDCIDTALLARTRAALNDDLGRGILWPVYPELAAAGGLLPTSPHWRTGEKAGAAGPSFGLEEMLQRSWAIYAAQPAKRAAMIQMLGGQDKVAAFGGA